MQEAKLPHPLHLRATFKSKNTILFIILFVSIFLYLFIFLFILCEELRQSSGLAKTRSNRSWGSHLDI